MRIPALLCFTALISAGSAHAGQPIFSEMPRWSDGWGVQAIQEFRHQRKVFSNGDERISTSHILNIDGVYTWKRWIRLTAKVPLVLNATREGEAPQRGFGPATIALPLKQYFNLFKLSRNPFTICWIVEILHLVSDKFNLGTDYLEKK